MIQVIVPFYNCLAWISRALYSIKIQEGCEYRVAVADDCSTDGSGEIARQLCEAYGFQYLRTEQNVKCPRNIVDTINSLNLDPETVIYIVDGDDCLTHPQSLKSVQDAYDAEPNIWMAYGKYESVPLDPLCHPAEPYPEGVIVGRSYRKHSNLFNHPLTFKAWFFNRIDSKALMSQKGEWLTTGYDRAFMWPLMEMATYYDGQHFFKCLDEVTYSYNSINPNSETPQQMSTEDSEFLKDMPPHRPIWK